MQNCVTTMKVKELEGGEDSKANMKRAWAKNMSFHLYGVLLLGSSGVSSINLTVSRAKGPWIKYTLIRR